MRPPETSADRLPKGLGISLGLADAPPNLACRLRGAQITAIRRGTPVAMGAQAFAGILLLIVLHRAGRLHGPIVVWFWLLGAACLDHGRSWLRSRRRGHPPHAASRRAIRRVVLYGLRSGALWGTLPVITGAGSAASGQLRVACITAGMMWAGSFMVATVPAAGLSTIALIAAGATCAVLRQPGGLNDAGLLSVIWAYAGMAAICVCATAHLFMEHAIATARLQAETAAREHAEAAMAHARRMSALGTLAAGIAHDFNNILQSVTGNATLLARRTGEAQHTHLLAGSILDAAERGGAISRRVLAFARQESLATEPVAVDEILHSAAELLEHTLHRSIRLGITAAPDLPPALADRAQLETVLVNLAANARDAMPRGGTLSFHAAAEAVGAGCASPHLAPGRYIRIDVADNGAGMDTATLGRAAEPFFTTKPKGNGTGLGLALARDFAEQSAGAFAIASEPGLGTVVTLWLPQASAAPPKRRPAVVAPFATARFRRLLVVDDDADVRDSLLRTLQEAGFDAVGVGHAAVARDLLARGMAIDLIIADFAIPGINGIELVEVAQALRPDLPAILLTGNVGDVTFSPDARFVLLQKPVRPHELIRHVLETLEAQFVS
jgi:signal transduction histidine kinase/CheY-like chemotaxis protein